MSVWWRQKRCSVKGMAAVAAVLAQIGLSACNDPTSEASPNLAEGCKIAPEQKGGFMAPLKADRAVKVVVDPAFTQEQKNAIDQAAAVWNVFSNRADGKDLFRTEPPPFGKIPAQGVPTQDDDCSFDTGASGGFRVIREESEDRWKALGLTENNPGVTLRCHSQGQLIKQVVLINPKYTNPAQFMSVMLHELGHAMGLDHSCTPGASKQDYIACQGLGEEHPYRQAVMFPVLRLNLPSPQRDSGGQKTQPELKEQLRKNDIERAYCLYNNKN